MNLKYRIKFHTFPFADSIFIAEYRAFGIWMKINNNQTGCLLPHSSTYCESLEEVKERIALHKSNMERSKDWWNRSITIIDVWKQES